MNTRKLFVAILIAIAIAVASVGTAFADSTRGPNVQGPGLWYCGNETLVIASPSLAATNAQVWTDNSIWIVESMTLTFNYIDPKTGAPASFSQIFTGGLEHGQAIGVQGALTTCTGHGTFDDPQLGTVTVDGVAQVLRTPFGH